MPLALALGGIFTAGCPLEHPLLRAEAQLLHIVINEPYGAARLIQGMRKVREKEKEENKKKKTRKAKEGFHEWEQHAFTCEAGGEDPELIECTAISIYLISYIDLYHVMLWTGIRD